MENREMSPPRTPDIRPLVVRSITEHLSDKGVPDAAARAEELVDRVDEIWADIIQGSAASPDLLDI